MKIVGITGGIGSGKSTICEIFSILGIPIYQADDRAKYLMNHHADLKVKIIAAFGDNAYTNGELNRPYISKTIFSDQAKVEQINALVHPAVVLDFKEWTGQQSSLPYVIKEAALMIESGSHKKLDYLINVFASLEVRIKRVLTRDSFRTEEEIRDIISKQVKEEIRTKAADRTIDNDGTHLVIPQVLAIHKNLSQS